MRRGLACRGDVFHDRGELPPLAATPLKLLQFAGQGHRVIFLPAVQKTSNQSDYLLHARRILLKQSPYQRFRLGKPSRCHQRIGIGFTEFLRYWPGTDLGFQNKDRRAHLAFHQQAFRVGQSDGLIRCIFLIGPLVPLRRIATFGRSREG